MGRFQKLSFWLSTAVTMTAMATIAAADPITAAAGTTASDTGSFLSIHTGVIGPNYITYGINMPAATCVGGSWCGSPTSLGSGYLGSSDHTWQQVTGAITQTMTWGTTNGNSNPVQAAPLDDGFGVYPLDGTGNFPAVNDGSLLGWGSSYSLGSAGSWSGSTPFIGVNSDLNDIASQYDTVYLYFDNPIAGFSALFNYNPDNGSVPLVAAFNAAGTLIGGNSAYAPSVSAGTDQGVMFGFLNGSSDIYMIALSDAFAVMGNISITYLETPPPPSEVPEPMTLALLGSGLLGLGAARRYRSK